MEQKFNSHTPKKRMHMSKNYTKDGERQNHTKSNKMQLDLNDSNEQRQAEINERIEEYNTNIDKYKSKIQSMTFKGENLKKISRYEYATPQFEDGITFLRNKSKKINFDFQDKIKTTDNKPISDKKSNYDNSKQMMNRIRNAFSSLSEKVDKYEGTSKHDPEYIYMDEMLSRFMIELDDIDMNGSEALRLERADIIKNIHKYVSILEDKIKTNVTIPRHPTELPLENDKTSDKTATCSGTSQNSGSSHVPKKREHKTMPIDMAYKDTNRATQNQTSSRSERTERCHKFNKEQYKDDKRLHRLTTKMNKSLLTFLYILENVINTVHDKHSNAKKILSIKRKLSLALDECIAKLNLMENENIKHEILPFFRQIYIVMKDHFLPVYIMETLEIRVLKGEILKCDFRIKKIKIQAIQDARSFFKALRAKLYDDFKMAYSRTERDSKKRLEPQLAVCTEILKKLRQENWVDDYELLFLREMHRLILSNFAFNDVELRNAKISDKNRVDTLAIFKKIESKIDKLENLANCFAGRLDDKEYLYINEMFTQNMIKLDDFDHSAPLLNETDVASISDVKAQPEIMCKIKPCKNILSMQNIYLYNNKITRIKPKKMNHTNTEAQLKFHDPGSDRNELERLEMKSPNMSIDLIRNDLLALIKQVNLYSGGRDQFYNLLRVSFLKIIDSLNEVKGGDDFVRLNLLNNAVFYLTVLDMKSKSDLKDRLFKPSQKLPPSHQLQNTFTNNNAKKTEIHIMDVDPNTLESHKSSQAKAFADINQKVAQIGDRLKQDTDISTLFFFHNQLTDSRSKIQNIHSDGEEVLQNKHMSLKYIDALSILLRFKLLTYTKNAY